MLAEKRSESRRIEEGKDGKNKTWLYLEWSKEEKVYGFAKEKGGLSLRGSARYISHGGNSGELPFLLSDKGYGILVAADGPTLSCDVPAYGSYLYTEDEFQMDYYFIAGKQQTTILNAYAYLRGEL